MNEETTRHSATETATWTLDPAPESTGHIQLEKAYDLFIGGQFVKSSGNKRFDSINPATEKPIAKITESTDTDVDNAVKAARECYDKHWSQLSGCERGKYIYRIARIMQERARELAVIESLDGGKPIRESRDIDIPLAAAHFFYYAGWADKLDYAFPNRRSEALGVAGQIIPWNFPLLMAAWKIAPALACGNTVVLKPAETTSLTAMKLAEIMQDADLPPGAVNIVTGHGKVGAAIVNHPDIDKIAFTGSTEVGKIIQQAIAGSRKRIVNGIYFNQGHVCCAGSRLFVQESVRDEVLRKLKHRMQSLIVGDPLDKNTDIGAINSREQLDTIESYIEIGKQEGADLFQPEGELPSEGFWCRPTLFTEVAQSNRIAQEEIFGPVLAVQTFRTVSEVIQKANNTPYGLSAGVWTDKGSKIFNLTSQMRAGVVWANTYNNFDPTSPFGGYKESGFGREGGLHGLAAYLKLQQVRRTASNNA